MNRFLVSCAVMVSLAAPVSIASASPVSQAPRRVDLPAGVDLAQLARPVVSLDGAVGFVAPTRGALLVAFAVGNGRVLGTVEGSGGATGLTVSESGGRRLIALAQGSGPTGAPASVTIVDASDPSAMRVLSVFALPETVVLARVARVGLSQDQRFGVVAVAAPVGALLSFDVETGQQVGALTLEGPPEQVWLVEGPGGARAVCLGTQTNEIAVATLGAYGELLPLSTFAPPEPVRLGGGETVAFDATGRLGYVAAPEGRLLLSFDIDTGSLLDRTPIGGVPSTLAVYHRADGDLVAVVHSPTHLARVESGDGTARVPGEAGITFVVADGAGRLTPGGRFAAQAGDEVDRAWVPEFSADGATIVLASRSDGLYFVDTETGSVRRTAIGGQVGAFAVAPLAEAVAVVVTSAGGSSLEILPIPGGRSSPRAERGGAADDRPPAAHAAATVPGIEAAPDSAGADTSPANVATEAPSAAARVSSPLAPVVTQVRPATIASRVGAVDLRVSGSGFREGAVATVGFTDATSGAYKTAALKTYRLGPTSIVARVPAMLTRRARDFELMVVDRDTVSVSAPVRIRIVGREYTLQVASHTNESVSRALAATLASAGVDAYVARADLADRGVWFRVRVGRYASSAEARSVGRRLIASGHVRECFVARFESER